MAVQKELTGTLVSRSSLVALYFCSLRLAVSFGFAGSSGFGGCRSVFKTFERKRM